MAGIVNLRQARKRKARAEREGQAEANRQKFGQPKAARKQVELEEKRAERAHSAHRRDDYSK